MGKSAETYYAEKLQQLLELQAAQRQNAPRLSAVGSRPRRTEQSQKTAAPEKGADRAYYEGFRTRMQQTPQTAARNQNGTAQRKAPASGSRNVQSPNRNAAARAGARPTADARVRTAADRGKQWTDKPQEEKKRVDAYKRATQGRKRRKLREILVSAVLMLGVFVVLCIVTYQLLFVIRNLDASGSNRYTSEEILAASGVDMGDHLYSFSSRVVQETIMLHCPYIAAVDVHRTPPGSIAFDIEEEEPVYYAAFYGEIWEISRSLRVLDPISESDAKEQGLIKLKLPEFKEAISGKRIAFSKIRSDDYMGTVLDTLQNSDLAERIGMIDLRSPYNISMVCDGKYKLLFGDVNVIDTKLRLAIAVLEDELFQSDNKASVDLTDLSATSVIIDNQLDLE